MKRYELITQSVTDFMPIELASIVSQYTKFFVFNTLAKYNPQLAYAAEIKPESITEINFDGFNLQSDIRDMAREFLQLPNLHTVNVTGAGLDMQDVVDVAEIFDGQTSINVLS